MDLSYSASEIAFRDEVRSFLADNLSPALADKVRTGRRLTRDDLEGWHRTLAARGWLAPHWPVAWGGPGWSMIERHIFDIETAHANAPRIVPFGVNMLGPVLLKFGTDEQRRHYLPRILDGRDWWCQGYSEPGAGSDLASLKMTAVRDGDHYVLNGQKTWTTLAQWANRIFCLVRTDPAAKKQEGISFLLVDMDAAGIERRPIRLIDGEAEVNELFFTDVRVPVANLVGRENDGWTVAKYLLTYERTNIAGVGASEAAFAQLKDVAARERRGGRRLIDDPLFAARMARVEIELANMATTNLRVLAAASAGAAPGPESSMLKIKGTVIRQEITDLYRRAFGGYARPFVEEALEDGWNGVPVGPAEAAPAAASYFNNRKLSIFGGSNEIQKGIIAKAMLGL